MPLKQLKFFYKNSYKINYFKTTTTKKQKTDKNIDNLIEQFFIVFFLNLACRLINEIANDQVMSIPKGELSALDPCLIIGG